MNCRQFESRIHELLDERRGLLGDARLSEHRRECPACQSKLRQFELLESHFRTTLKLDPRAIGDDWGRARGYAVPREPGFTDRRPIAFAAMAALLLAMAIPVLILSSHTPNATVAEHAPISNPLIAELPDLDGPVPWPQMLATIEDLPRRLEGLGPVYLCTAQMTGVSSLTSSFNLTVDLLRLQLGHETPWKDPGDDSRGRYEKALTRMQTA